MQKVAVIHTSPVSLNELKALFAELLPEVEMTFDIPISSYVLLLKVLFC